MFVLDLKHRSTCRWFAIGVGLVLFCAWSGATPGLAQTDEVKPTAQILSLIVKNGKGIDTVVDTTKAVTVTRAPNRCLAVTEVRKGLPLCAGDVLKTASGAKVKIAFGDPNEGNEVTIDEASEITISSIICGSLCNWFASLHNYFTNRVQHVALTNRGTTYQVVLFQDQSAELVVYEGEVDVTPDSGSDTNSSSPRVAPVTVNSLSKIVIDANGNPGEKEALTREDLCGKLASSTATEVSLHQTPPEVGGNVAKFVNFLNSAKRNDALATARCASFWEPSQALNFEILGYVYNDWGDATKALANFNKASLLYARSLPGWSARDELRINKAIAYRQLGEYDAALAELEPVLAKTTSTLLGDALNVRGSVYYDQALGELLRNQTNEGLTNAKELLAKAGGDYEAALSKNGNQKQYIEVNRGQVVKAEGDIAQREGDYARAEAKYIEAIRAMMLAYGEKDNPQNKIASLSVARARGALANTYAAMGRSKESEDFYKRAEETYQNAIQDAAKEQQNFAAAYCGLGSLYLIQGKPEAADNYSKCAAFNIAALVTDVTVPNVVGLHRATAIHVLAEAGLEPEIVVDGDVVETQEPVAGAVVKTGTKIKIRLPIRERS